MQIFVTLIAFVVAISVLIIFHELGHYLAAKLCNVKVLRFSIGFGKPLWARKYGQDLTEWTVCLLPLGGFVRMLDEREGDVFPEEAHRAFNRQSVWHRIFIVCAGPFSNLILAILIYTSMFIYGVPGVRPVIGYVAPGSIATKIHLVPGDVIYSINGHPILTWQSMAVRLTEAAATGHSINLIVNKNKAKTHIVLNSKLLTTVSLDQNLVKQLGIFPPEPFVPGVLGTVEPGSPAAKAGLVAGDKIMTIEGRAFTNWENLVAVVRSEPNKPVQLVVSHGKQTSYATVTPRLIYVHHQKRGWIGVGPLVDPVQVNALRVTEHDTVLTAFIHGISRTTSMSWFTLEMIGKLIIGHAALSNLSGPLTIADYAGQSARMGLIPYMTFLALVSISLGILNLLPIPLLDGGHLLYYMAEIVKGGPVSEKAQLIGQRIGGVLLICLMIFAFYNDINRLFIS